MVNSATNGFKQNGAFIDRMEGGAFIFSADDSHRILYANEKLVRLFECENEEELYERYGGKQFYHNDEFICNWDQPAGVYRTQVVKSYVPYLD